MNGNDVLDLSFSVQCNSEVARDKLRTDGTRVSRQVIFGACRDLVCPSFVFCIEGQSRARTSTLAAVAAASAVAASAVAAAAASLAAAALVLVVLALFPSAVTV
jgi:hypothetical protein